MIQVEPEYAAISAVRDICREWINVWDGDEWGESMSALHRACKTDYGFSDEDCALFASKLLENLMAQKVWMDEEGYEYDFPRAADLEDGQIVEECRRLRDYWREGGNLKGFEHHAQAGAAMVDKLPGWMFGEDDGV